MTRAKPKDEAVDVEALRKEKADMLRAVCTELGLPDNCPFKACRRARRCSTARVICYQVLRQEINALVLPMLRARTDGTPMPEWPTTDEDWDAFFETRWPDSATPDKLGGT